MDFLNYALANPLSNIIGIIGLVVGIIGAVLTCIFYRRSHRSKEPCWSVRNNVLVEGYSSKIGKLDIRFKDEQVENLSIARIAFWNQGAETLDRHDIETINPLRIEADEEIEILDVSVSLTNSSSSQFETELVNDRKSAKLDFAYLDKGQGAIVQIIHTGIKESDIQIVGDIKSVKEIKKKNVLMPNTFLTSFFSLYPFLFSISNRKILPSSRRKSLGIAFAITAILMLLLFGITLDESTSRPDLFIVVALSFVYGIVLLSLAILLFRRGLPSGLEAFENEPLL